MARIINKEEKCKHVTQAALELFLEKGYKSVTTREIATKAGISKGILYHYFESKEDLFYKTVKEHIVHTVILKGALEDSSKSPMDRFLTLKDLCDTGADLRKRRYQLIFYFIVYCSDKKLVSEVIDSIYDEIRTTITKILTDAFPEAMTNPDKVALYSNLVAAYIDGIHFQNFINPEKVRLEDTNKLFWELIQNDLQSVSVSHTGAAGNV